MHPVKQFGESTSLPLLSINQMRTFVGTCRGKRYLNSNLSLSDASRHLGLGAEQVAKVRELVLGS
jgi:hypothetical protein